MHLWHNILPHLYVCVFFIIRHFFAVFISSLFYMKPEITFLSINIFMPSNPVNLHAATLPISNPSRQPAEKNQKSADSIKFQN